MRRLMLTLAVTVLTAAGCSSSEPLAFDLSHPMEPPEAPFTVSGPAADEGIVCSVGMWVEDRMEDMEGNELTEGGVGGYLRQRRRNGFGGRREGLQDVCVW